MGLKVSFFILWLSGYYLVIQKCKSRKRSTKKRGMQKRGVPGRDRRIKDIKDIRTHQGNYRKVRGEVRVTYKGYAIYIN